MSLQLPDPRPLFQQTSDLQAMGGGHKPRVEARVSDENHTVVSPRAISLSCALTLRLLASESPGSPQAEGRL